MQIRSFFFVYFTLAVFLLVGTAGFIVFGQKKTSHHLVAEPSHEKKLIHPLLAGEVRLPHEIISLQGVGNPPVINTSLLTGQEREKNNEEIILGVMIDEAMQAREFFTGIESAKVIFEIPAEGGIPRLMALFSSDDLPPLVGPVRSARPYFVSLAESIASAYVHAGGSPKSLEMLFASSMVNIDEHEPDTRFIRDESISRPHNLFVIPQKAVEQVHDVSKKQPLFQYSETLAGEAKKADFLKVSFSTQRHDVRWVYDSESNCYVRNQEYESSSLCPENVVVLVSEMWRIEGDEKKRINVQITGSGPAVILRDGKRVSGQWRRNPKGTFSFYDEQEKTISLQRGTTFIEIIDSSKKYSFINTSEDK